MTSEDRRMNSPPKWVNPCGLAAEDFDGDLDVVQLKDEQLLGQVVVQAKTALEHARMFRDDYVSTSFYIWLEYSCKIHSRFFSYLNRTVYEYFESINPITMNYRLSSVTWMGLMCTRVPSMRERRDALKRKTVMAAYFRSGDDSDEVWSRNRSVHYS